MNPRESIRRARRALREPISTAQMQIVVPLCPPSVNHYKRPKAGGGFYLTPEAKNFKAAVASLSRGSVDAKLYYVRVNIYLGKGDRGDGDNFNKCVGDALVDARIIHSDAKIKKWDVEKFRDREEPRTEILIWPWDENFVPVSPSVALDTIGFVQAMQAEAEAMTGALPVNGIERPGRPCRTHGALLCRQCHGGQITATQTRIMAESVQNVQNVQEKKPPQSEPASGAVEPAWPAADSPQGTLTNDGNLVWTKLIRARLERRIERKR